jgi:hypothetical protein
LGNTQEIPRGLRAGGRPVAGRKTILLTAKIAAIAMLAGSLACSCDGDPTRNRVPTPTPKRTETARITPTPTPSKRAKVRIRWTTQSEESLYGFNIHRGLSQKGPWTRVNPTPILAAEGGNTNVPQDYEYTDTDPSLVLDQEYWYWLQAVENNGRKRRVWPPQKVTASVAFDEEFPPPPKEE